MPDCSPIESLSGPDALRQARHNPLRRYPSPQNGSERLFPLPCPEARPSFTIGPADTVFAVGSCFARNIEDALSRAGANVTSLTDEVPSDGITKGKTLNLFNKYTVHSALNELDWALDRARFPGAALLYSTPDGGVHDCQLGVPRVAVSPARYLRFRDRLLDNFARIRDADVVIFTLGYIEAWFDTRLGIYLNVAPPPRVVRADPDRFRFDVLSHDDVVAGLEAFITRLRDSRDKPLRMLLTVSPVPLASTFRDMDVLLANMYSKSVQRAACELIASRHDGVDYFPSYEHVVLSDPRIAWVEDDYRHVTPDLVARIMARVFKTYMPDMATPGAAPAPVAAQLGLSELVSEAKMLHKLEKWEALHALLHANDARLDQHVDLLVMAANTANAQGNRKGTYAFLLRAREVNQTRPMILERLARIATEFGWTAAAGAHVADHARDFPARHDALRDTLAAIAPRG